MNKPILEANTMTARIVDSRPTDSTVNPDREPEAKPATRRAPPAWLASRRHLLTFFFIWGVVTGISELNAPGSAQPAEAPRSQADMLELYLVLMGMQCLWVRFVSKGMQSYGRSITEFLQARRNGPMAIAWDAILGGLALLLIYSLYAGLNSLTHRDLTATNALLPAVPTGALAVTVWAAMSLCAGICEEIVFRGYLQGQLTALTGKPALAIVLQAGLFGIAHVYEGFTSVCYIVLHALVLGLLAAWRGNVRACMVEHAAWDILEGLGLMTI